LGGNRGAVLSEEARATGRASQMKRADERAVDLQPVIRDLNECGVTTMSGIARMLNERAIPTARGGKGWTATQVVRVMGRS